MDNNALWQLTAESVSDVLYATDRLERLEGNINPNISNSLHREEEFLHVTVNVVVRTSRRVIKKQNFTLSSNSDDNSQKEKKVLVLR